MFLCEENITGMYICSFEGHKILSFLIDEKRKRKIK